MKDDEDGVWRTICGRRVFIKDGWDLHEALRQSGKFEKLEEEKKKFQNVKEKLKSIENKTDGTYDINTGEPIDFKDGYQCSFCKTSDNYSDEEFDDLCKKWAKDTDENVYAGKFGGSPEVSFHFTDVNEAMAMAEQYDQWSIWDFTNSKEIRNLKYKKGMGNDL